MFHNSTNINKVNNHLSNEINEHKKDHDVNKIERYDITEILLNTITLTPFLQYKSQCLKKVNVKYVINR